jgi:hypothetical protein
MITEMKLVTTFYAVQYFKPVRKASGDNRSEFRQYRAVY